MDKSYNQTNGHKVSDVEIAEFMEGRDSQERIVNLTYNNKDSFVRVFYRNEKDEKCVENQAFYPFCWATRNACNKLCNGNRAELKKLLSKYAIGVKRLSNTNFNGEVVKEFENGYIFMFFALKPMSYNSFSVFFNEAKNPLFGKKAKQKTSNNDYLCLNPQEQFMIHTGKRFFKGYTDYDQTLRMIFDLETEGLDPRIHRIKLNGVKLNRPVVINGKQYGKNIDEPWFHLFRLYGTTKEEQDKSELEIIELMVRLIYTFKPDIITAHNGENFDWNFLITRAEMCGSSMEEISKKYFKYDFIKKDNKESILKLGGEIETFKKTLVPNTIVTDSLHAVRRAQATDSNFKEANLKYATSYLKLKKPNRVYTPGNEIDAILMDTEKHYAFNNENGDWYLYNPSYVPPKNEDVEFKMGKVDNKPFVMYTRNYIKDGYQLVSGEYIIHRYLMDDLWECDKVEAKLNTSNFFICKILPLPYSKCVTMGTAGQWKSIMLAWSYDHDLAIPIQENSKLTVGGLSRLTQVGYTGWKDGNKREPSIAKLDYNSLYPSIILSNGYYDWPDLSNVTLSMLNFVLTSREKYKGLKKQAEKIVDSYKEKMADGYTLSAEEKKEFTKASLDFALNDKIQNSWKILGNSYFGSLGSVNANVYPWKSTKNAHQITATGRQMLRMMIYQFINMGKLHGLGEEYDYHAVVGDSFTGDTPLFIKYDDSGYIDIKSICELINEQEIHIDELNREYDCSIKPYSVLCRSGWVKPDYIYRHKTHKDIYDISDSNTNMRVEVTEDHSLFDADKQKIKPSQLNENTSLEYYNDTICGDKVCLTNTVEYIKSEAKKLALGKTDRVPVKILNSIKNDRIMFYKEFMRHSRSEITYSKTCIAGIQFLLK